MNSHKLKSIIITTLVIIFIAIIAFYFLVIPRIINVEKYRPQIQQLQERINLPTELGEMETSLTPSLGIRVHFENIEIKHSDNTEFISTGNVSAEIALLPLIDKEVVIRQIRINDVVANITRMKNGKFDIQQLIPEIRERPEGYKVRFKNTDILVNNYKINFKDNFIAKNPSYTVKGDEIRISDLTPERFIRIEAAGQILFPEKPNANFDISFASKLPLNFNKILSEKFILRGQVSNLYPAEFLPYINKYTPYNFSDIQGNANLRFNVNLRQEQFRANRVYAQANLNNFFIENATGNVIAKFPNKTNIEFNGNINNNNLFIEQAKIESANVNAGLEGAIRNFKAENRDLNLRLNILNSRIEALVGMFPQGLNLPTDIIGKLQKYNVSGNVSSQVSITGRAKTPNLEGYLTFNDFAMIADSTEIPRGSGRINFTGQNFTIDARTYVDKAGYLNVTGLISPQQEFINLSITSNELNLNPAYRLLLALHDVIGFPIGPLDQAMAFGRGEINLDIKGKFDDVSLFGFLNVINATVNYFGLSKPVQNITGRIIFDNDRIVYNGASGFLENSKVTAQGFTTLEGFSNIKLSFPNLNLAAAHNLVNTSPALAEVQNALQEIERISGFADFTLYLTGAPENVSFKGIMDFNNAILAYRGLGQAATNLNGIFRFEDDALFFDNLTGTIAQSPIQVNGSFLIDENIDIILTSNRLNLAGVKNLIANSPILSEIQEILRDFTLLNGFSQAQLSLSGNPNANFFDNLRLNSITGSFIHALAGFPVDILSGNLLITQNIISTDKINARALGSPIIVSGQVSGLEQELIPRLNIAVQNFNFARFPELVQAPIVTNDIRRFIGDFSDFSGQMDVNINLLPNTFRVLIQPERVYALYQPANVDLELHSGNIAITPENIEFSPLYGIISDSLLYVDGLARNYQNAPVLNLVASAKIAPQDIEEYINPLLDEPITVQGIIPIAVSAQGELNDWKILAQATLEKGANVFIRSDIGLPQDKIRVFSLNAQGNTDMIRVNNLELATGDDIIEVGTSASPNPEKVTELRRLIGAYGAINEIQSESPEFENFYIETPNPVNITLLNPAIQAETPFFTEGEMRFKALLNGDVSNPDTTGSAVVENVSIPSRDTFIEFARARLDENALILDESSINIADSSMNINAIASRNFERPFTIRQIIINASMFNIDSIIEALSQPETAEQEEQTPFIIVERGSIEAEELILGDLLAANVRSCFNLSPDWVLAMPNLSLQIAQGEVTGEVLYNINTQELYSRLIAQEMSANAAATVLLSTPNEVYGTLSGETQFRTSGGSRDELISNANGFATFEITDGRLTRLGSLEYLLRAVNVLQSGITGLTLNNIIDLVIPQRTGDFEVLEGTITAENGVLTTDNIASRGDNLSLFLSGNMDMISNYSDLTILGRLSRRVAGLLGPIGSLSIGTFVNFIPGIGFLPIPSERGLLELIPGLRFIPGLGLGERGRYREFVVDIEGDLYDPASVRSFRFVNQD